MIIVDYGTRGITQEHTSHTKLMAARPICNTTWNMIYIYIIIHMQYDKIIPATRAPWQRG